MEERNYVPEHITIISCYLRDAEKLEGFEIIALKMLREIEGDIVGCKEVIRHTCCASIGQHLGRK